MYHPHPHVFALVDVLLEFQDMTYINMRDGVPRSNADDNATFVQENMTKLESNDITRFEFVRTVSRKTAVHELQKNQDNKEVCLEDLSLG